MGILSSIVGTVDTLVLSTGESIFNTVLADITQIVGALGVLGIAIAGLQHVMGTAKYMQYFSMGVRYSVVFGTLLVWGQFSNVYSAFDGAFNSYALKIVQTASASASSGGGGGGGGGDAAPAAPPPPPKKHWWTPFANAGEAVWDFATDATEVVVETVVDGVTFGQGGEIVGNLVGNAFDCIEDVKLNIGCLASGPDGEFKGPSIADALAGASSAGNGNDASAAVMDAIVENVFGVSRLMFEKVSFLQFNQSMKYIFFGIVIFVVGVFYAGASALILIYSKIGLIVAIALAPIGMGLLIIPATTQYFHSWLKFTLSFMIVPLLVGTLAGFLALISSNYIGNAASPEIVDNIALVIVVVAGIYMTMQVPSMAAGLTGGGVGAGSAFGAISGAAGLYKAATGKGGSGSKGSAGSSGGAGAKGAGAAGVALAAGQMLHSASSSMSSSSAARKRSIN